MPICQTCHGEYERSETLCPSCEQPLGRGRQLCHLCGVSTEGKRLCPRCRSDVSVWEVEISGGFGQFLTKRGGIAGLVPSLAAVLLGVLYWPAKEVPLYHSVFAWVGIALAVGVFFLLYEQRLPWRVNKWASQVCETSAPPFAVLLAGGVVIALAAGVAVWVMTHLGPEFDTRFMKLVFAGLYTLVLIGFTVTFTVGVIQADIERLDQVVPQPIFVNVEHLLRVVLDTVLRKISGVNGEEVAQCAVQCDADLRYETLEVTRDDEDGGIHVLLLTYKHVERPNEDAEMRELWVKQTWEINADRWGRVASMRPGRAESGGLFV